MILERRERSEKGDKNKIKSRIPVIFISFGRGVVWVWLGIDRLLIDRSPIVVGILHSQTGPMAISEKSMIDAEVLALEEINKAGGLLGKQVRWVIADGASDPVIFARQAAKLIREDGVNVVFGCWTSASRKSVLPVVETANHLLVYPMAYEGLEQSPNIVYTGAAPNQQITPAVQWCHETLSARRFFLVGSDYIWPHCVNAIISDQLVGWLGWGFTVGTASAVLTMMVLPVMIVSAPCLSSV